MNPHSQNAQNQKSKLEDRLLDSPPPQHLRQWAAPLPRGQFHSRNLRNLSSGITYLPCPMTLGSSACLCYHSKPFGSFTSAKLGAMNCEADVGSSECEGSLSSLLLHGLFFFIRTPQIKKIKKNSPDCISLDLSAPGSAREGESLLAVGY